MSTISFGPESLFTLLSCAGQNPFVGIDLTIPAEQELTRPDDTKLNQTGFELN